MDVRPATPDDAEAIARVGTETWHDTYDDVMGRGTVTDLTDEWYDPDAVRDYFDDDGFAAYVAEADGVVGYAYSRAGEDGLWHLPAVYVLPERQGEGIGAALADRVEADARAADADRVRLVVLDANESARAFYEARGYRETGEREESVVEGTTEVVYELQV